MIELFILLKLKCLSVTCQMGMTLQYGEHVHEPLYHTRHYLTAKLIAKFVSFMLTKYKTNII
jgi:hypothetical protein